MQLQIMPEPITCMYYGIEASLILVMVDIINVVFQSKHLNRIIAGLEMFSPFKYLHQKNKENFITSVIRPLGVF
jgi:hypothetical protein